MPLNDSLIRGAKAQAKQYKLHDERGLLLLIKPTGGKLWRLKYRIGGTEKALALGAYPEVTLKEARDRRDAARKLLAAGADPATEKRRAAAAAQVQAANTFKSVADDMIARTRGKADATLAKYEWQLGRLKALWPRPIADVKVHDLRDILRHLEARGNLEAAKQVRAFASRVFRHAILWFDGREDPAAHLARAFGTPQVQHHAAVTEPQGVGALLRAIDGFQGQPATLHALRLAPHVFARPGELRQAEWSEMDLEAGVWMIPATRTKMRKPHAVPLSRQAVAILRDMHAISGQGVLVFPGLRPHRPLSENTLNAALRRMGYAKDEMTAHGFRTIASTLLHGSGKWRREVVEQALAHGKRDAVEAAYNRSTYWDERVQMAQWWSDHLDTLRVGATVIALPVRAG